MGLAAWAIEMECPFEKLRGKESNGSNGDPTSSLRLPKVSKASNISNIFNNSIIEHHKISRR